MRARVVRVLVALAMIVGVPGGFVAFTAVSASAQYIGVTVTVSNGAPTELEYEDSTQFLALDASLLASSVDIADFAETGESEPDYELGPVANVGTVTDGEVIDIMMFRVARTGSFPVFDVPGRCFLDGSGNGTCNA